MRSVFCILLIVVMSLNSSFAARPWGGATGDQKVKLSTNDGFEESLEENQKEAAEQVKENDDGNMNHMLQGCNLAIQTQKEQLFFRKGEVLVRKIRSGDESRADESHLTTSTTARWV